MTRLVHLYRKRWRRDRGDYEPRIRPTVNSGGRTRYDPNSDNLSRIHIGTPLVNYRKAEITSRHCRGERAWTEHQVPAVLRRYWNISFYFGENPNEQYVHTVRNVNTERERKKRGEIGQNLSTQDVENLASRAAFFER